MRVGGEDGDDRISKKKTGKEEYKWHLRERERVYRVRVKKDAQMQTKPWLPSAHKPFPLPISIPSLNEK